MLELKTMMPLSEQRIVNRNYWTSRTYNIGEHLAKPIEKQLKKRRDELHAIEEEQLANGKHSHILKNVLHRGYWKYKKEHYRDPKSVVVKVKPALSQLFDKAIENVLDLSKTSTALENKYTESKRFEFSP